MIPHPDPYGPPLHPGPPDEIAATGTPFGRWRWVPGPPNYPRSGYWHGPTPDGTHDAYLLGTRLLLVARQ